MSDITLSPPELLTQEPLMAFSLATSVHAGFPSPAADFSAKRIDIMDRLVVHPQATYAMRVSGESMRELGIFDADVLLVDKAVKPRHGMVVIAIVALVLAVFALVAFARDLDQDEALKLRQKGVILPLEQLLETALGRHPGARLLEAELEEDDDRYEYEVELLTVEGVVREIKLDASTGALLKDEEDD